MDASHAACTWLAALTVWAQIFAIIAIQASTNIIVWPQEATKGIVSRNATTPAPRAHSTMMIASHVMPTVRECLWTAQQDSRVTATAAISNIQQHRSASSALNLSLTARFVAIRLSAWRATEVSSSIQLQRVKGDAYLAITPAGAVLAQEPMLIVWLAMPLIIGVWTQADAHVFQGSMRTATLSFASTVLRRFLTALTATMAVSVWHVPLTNTSPQSRLESRTVRTVHQDAYLAVSMQITVRVVTLGSFVPYNFPLTPANAWSDILKCQAMISVKNVPKL